MLHYCNCCNYSSNQLAHYLRHLETIKHKTKLEIIKKQEELIKKQEELIKKEEEIAKKEEYRINNENEINKNLLLVSNKITKLEKTVKTQADKNNKEIIKEAIKTNKKIEEVKKIATKNKEYAKSTLSILNEIYKDNPPLEYIGDAETLTAIYKYYGLTKHEVMKTNKLHKLLAKDQKNKTLSDSFTKILAKILKKDNPHLQSIFNLDVTRDNYATKDEDSWKKDKAGMFLNEKIIQPFCTIIKSLMRNYIKYKVSKSSHRKKQLMKDSYSDDDIFMKSESETEFEYKDDSSDDEKRCMDDLDELCYVTGIIKYIDSDKLHGEIISKLSPILNFGVRIRKS